MSFTENCTDRVQAMQDFLCEFGAHRTKHSGRTLLAHLQNTYALLAAANQPEHICNAGFFHSVYGTSIFEKSTISERRRAEVVALIGEEAESLAWLFCQLDRPNVWKTLASRQGPATLRNGQHLDLQAQREQLRACAVIEAANLLDQQQLHRSPSMVKVARRSGLLDAFGNSVLRQRSVATRNAHKALMLDGVKVQLKLQLDRALVALRSTVVSTLPAGELLRMLKLSQVQTVLATPASAHENPEFLQSVGLVAAHATARGLSLVDAAASITAKATHAQQLIYQSEIERERISGLILNIKDWADVNSVTKAVRALSNWTPALSI